MNNFKKRFKLPRHIIVVKPTGACNLDSFTAPSYLLCLTADQQSGKMTPNGRYEDCSDCFSLAALAKATAFPPWLTFHQS